MKRANENAKDSNNQRPKKKQQQQRSNHGIECAQKWIGFCPLARNKL